MKTVIILFTSVIVLSACDPALTGNLVVVNESSDTLRLKYEIGDNLKDTENVVVLPNECKEIYALGGIGDKREFNCCPCVATFYTLKSSYGNVKKDISQKSNWEIPNKNKLKTFGSEPVKCRFIVKDSDL